MSLSYQPSNDAKPDSIWDTTFLSDRDVSAQVPINFVPHPGIHVTAACFSDGIYESSDTQTCLSNLLASQIRRYVFDIYWDTTNRRFSLCPVEIPNLNSSVSSSAHLNSRMMAWLPSADDYLIPRQTDPFYDALTSSSGSSDPVSTPKPAGNNFARSDLIQLGPYQCSPDLSFYSVTSLFDSYLAYTSNTLEAKITVWILNIHIAASSDAPTQPRTSLEPSQLPASNELVRTYFDELDDILYTPTLLLSDRSNLNASWFHESNPIQLPLTDYFTMRRLDNGGVATDDGWPDETYIQVTRGKRMLVGIGEVDDLFRQYNVSGEGDRLFGERYLSSSTSTSFNTSGRLDSGCFYNPDKFNVAQLNNSWAVATLNNIDPPDLGAIADNLTVCGISPVVNTTIDHALADASPIPYRVYGNQAVFSWAYGQPVNDSAVGADNDDKFRCALIVSSSDYSGHWRVEYCSQKYRVACRVDNEPYRWTIAPYTVPYGSAGAACTGNSTFDVPRTGLENTYLYWHIQNESQSDSALLSGVWINFNSLDYQSCWVTTGENGECPYLLDQDATHSRQILIPTIAALIVLVLTVLTVLIKCTTNRRNSRTRKRGEGGWDYEGVPS